MESKRKATGKSLNVTLEIRILMHLPCVPKKLSITEYKLKFKKFTKHIRGC